MNDIKKDHLTPEQYAVTQEHATEAPYTGEYYKTKTKGVYRCVVCGEPLFSSETKFDSHSGWPSFYQPIGEDSIGEQSDTSAGMERTEVHCKKCGAHMGHVFNDAPDMPTGKRYCINSAGLDLKAEEGGE